MFPICSTTGRTLFEFAAEKVLQHSTDSGRSLPLAVMTSRANDEEIQAFFASHHWFGLDERQVEFFTQRELAWIDDEGNPVLSKTGAILMAPSGNGEALHQFFDLPIGQRWLALGIDHLSIFPVDNPLADPFRPALIGAHLKGSQHVTIQAILREDPEEKLGIIVIEGEHHRIVEYCEISDEERLARGPYGVLKHPLGNGAVLCFDLRWVQAQLPAPLSWHVAKKSIPDLSAQKAWKFETFIFDWLRYATRTGVIVFPRALSFAPLKNREGSASIESVRNQLFWDERCDHALT
jgi:UDP-N-acetylglucosamine/UDP-N-acetylgalactosamine diphosphorylase